MGDDNIRLRAKRKRLHVTFPNGKQFCYSNATTTMIEVLKEIGEEQFPLISLEMCKLPLVSKEIYPRYKAWMKPICSGWYINSQSNTDTKYLQLRAISDSLKLGLRIELDSEIDPMENPVNKATVKRPQNKLLVKFPDGEFVANENSLDTFLECVWKLGLAEISRRPIECNGNPLITSYKDNNKRIQVDANKWIYVPATTKERARLLRIIALFLHIKLEITVI